MKKENLFAHIDTLDELKPYICPKAVSTRDWESICMECKGKCDAGKRAIQILAVSNFGPNTAGSLLNRDEATKPDIPRKTGRGIISNNMAKKRVEFQKQQRRDTYNMAREVFGKAVAENRDPREVFCELAGIKPAVARHRIESWIRKFPDLDKELHMFDIMGKYVRHRSDTLARRHASTESQIPGTSDEISIGDILKAADEGRVKTDSVEETESGVKIQAHIEAAQKQVNEVLTQHDAVTLSEFREKIGLDPLWPGDYPPIGEGGFTVDNPFPCEAAPVPFSPNQMFPDEKGGFRVIGDTSEAIAEPNDNVNRPGHYTFGAIEVIDYIRDKMTPEMFQGFCMGNVLKYVSRHKHKNGIEDLKKANVYLGWLIESEEKAAE